MEKVVYISSVHQTYPLQEGFDVVGVMNPPKSVAEEMARLLEIRQSQREEVFKIVNGNINFAHDKAAIKKYLVQCVSIRKKPH